MQTKYSNALSYLTRCTLGYCLFHTQWCSGVNPGNNWETIWSTGDWTQVGYLQGKHLICCIIAPTLDLGFNVWNSWVMRFTHCCLQRHFLLLSEWCSQGALLRGSYTSLPVPNWRANPPAVGSMHSEPHSYPSELGMGQVCTDSMGYVTVGEDSVAIFQYTYTNLEWCVHSLKWANDLSAFFRTQLQLSCTELMGGNRLQPWEASTKQNQNVGNKHSIFRMSFLEFIPTLKLNIKFQISPLLLDKCIQI